MKQRDFTSARAKEALLKDKEDMCCGNCCWFCFEQTDGDGQCMTVGYHGMPYGALTYCDTPSCKHFVSREEMRHHMAVLLQADRWYRATHDEENSALRYMPDPIDYRVALAFAYQYMKVFSKL